MAARFFRPAGVELPASVVLVHDDPNFVEEATAAVRTAGHDVVSFADLIVALEALEASERIQVLITRITFPAGKPHGVSLALMVQTKHPGLKVLFAARAHWEEYTGGIGELIPHPVDLPKLIETVTRLLQETREPAPPVQSVKALKRRLFG